MEYLAPEQRNKEIVNSICNAEDDVFRRWTEAGRYWSDTYPRGMPPLEVRNELARGIGHLSVKTVTHYCRVLHYLYSTVPDREEYLLILSENKSMNKLVAWYNMSDDRRPNKSTPDERLQRDLRSFRSTINNFTKWNSVEDFLIPKLDGTQKEFILQLARKLQEDSS